MRLDGESPLEPRLLAYDAIGRVESEIHDLRRPEETRGLPARLVLEPRFAPAVSALAIGQHLWVITHLHQARPWEDRWMPELFTRRIASRPNPIGVTLVRVVALEASTITIVGLDAVDGTPILDIKPYQPIWDAPPVTPQERKP
jgi:tRNA (adenine37-N6)-methyltransferase